MTQRNDAPPPISISDVCYSAKAGALRLHAILLILLSLAATHFNAASSGADEPVFPQRQWLRKQPQDVGLDADRLADFGSFVGGRGCVVRHGYLVYSWGDIGRRGDIASAAKPFYSHFLWLAIERGLIANVDERVVKWEPRLRSLNSALDFKDRQIRWRDFANQTSCYQLKAKPGTAFAYNDWQMALFWDTLFLKVYKASYENVDADIFHPFLTEKIGCQDNPTMMAFGVGNRPGRVAISVRDFARFGLLYLRQGRWLEQQLIRREHATMAVTSPLPNSIPRAPSELAEMIPGQRTVGSDRKPDNQTDHFGSYSWLWWINGVDRSGQRMFPDAPHDTFGAFGHGGPRAMWVIPSLDIIVSYNDANMRTWISGPENPTNQAMKLLVAATGITE
jgi:CubicO group peptidase (beta-lactamase class C family)